MGLKIQQLIVKVPRETAKKVDDIKERFNRTVSAGGAIPPAGLLPVTNSEG